MLLISGLFIFADAMLLPVYAIFVEEIGGGVTTAANSYAVFWLTAGVLTFVAGKYESKMKESELSIALSMYIVGAAFILYYFTNTIEMLYAVMVVLGIGNAIYWPAFHSVYGKHVSKDKSAMQWGFYDGLTYIIPAAGAAIGGWIVSSYGFNVIFLIMAVLAFTAGTFVVLLPRKLL